MRSRKGEKARRGFFSIFSNVGGLPPSEEQLAQCGMSFLILKMTACANPNPIKGQATWPGDRQAGLGARRPQLTSKFCYFLAYWPWSPPISPFVLNPSDSSSTLCQIYLLKNTFDHVTFLLKTFQGACLAQ